MKQRIYLLSQAGCWRTQTQADNFNNEPLHRRRGITWDLTGYNATLGKL
jgi:hypothetical protein